MNNDEWAIVKDIIFLYESGISPEDIAKVKKIGIEKVQSIVDNVKVAIKKRSRMNVVQEVGNQNKWKDELPAEEILAQMVESLEAEDRHDGARTVPSRPIERADRSDRVGEDMEMIDKIEGQKAAEEAPEPLKEIVELATIEQRKRDRSGWEDLRSEISELLDDDLDL
mgnify:FL=1|tara:strand:+ start:3504 stop:4007 length:504 start_codon:yes stop_codon:yes gene_type:complete